MGRLLAPLRPHTVHLCIDLQNLFGPDGPWVTPWMNRFLPLAAEIVGYAPERTIFTRFIPPQNKQAARGAWRAYYAASGLTGTCLNL